MGKFSKIFHHIESKDLRNKHEQKKAAKIQEEKKRKEFKQYLVSTMETKKYNWREGMTTSDVSTINVDKVTGDGDVAVIDAIDNSSYANVKMPVDIGTDGVVDGAFVGTEIRNSGTGSGVDGGFNVGGQYLAFQGTGDAFNNARFASLGAIDSSRVDTLTITAIVGNDTNGGEDPDLQAECLFVLYKTPAMDRAQFLAMTPGGEITSNNDIIIATPLDGQSGRRTNNGGLNDYSIAIPEYARAEGTQFVLYQNFNSGVGFDHFGVTKINFQRKTPLSVVVPLDDPEASSFIRSAPPKSTPKKRKQAVDDKLEASDKYTGATFGNDFPGREVRVGGEDPFASAKIGDDVKPSPQSKDEVKKSFGAAELRSALGKPTTSQPADPQAKVTGIVKSGQAKSQPASSQAEVDLGDFQKKVEQGKTKNAVNTIVNQNVSTTKKLEGLNNVISTVAENNPEQLPIIIDAVAKTGEEATNERKNSLLQGLETVKNTVSGAADWAGDTINGFGDAFTVLNQMSQAVTSAYKEGNVEDGKIKEGAPGSLSNPITTKVSNSTAQDILKGVDLNDLINQGEFTSSTINQLLSNLSADPISGNLGAKAIHNNLDPSNVENIRINENGDLVIPDTYAFRPLGHENNPLTKAYANIIGVLGGDKDEATKDFATILDQSIGAIFNVGQGALKNITNPIGSMLDIAKGKNTARTGGFVPGRDDPAVQYETIIPKEQLLEILKRGDKNIPAADKAIKALETMSSDKKNEILNNIGMQQSLSNITTKSEYKPTRTPTTYTVMGVEYDVTTGRPVENLPDRIVNGVHVPAGFPDPPPELITNKDTSNKDEVGSIEFINGEPIYIPPGFDANDLVKIDPDGNEIPVNFDGTPKNQFPTDTNLTGQDPIEIPKNLKNIFSTDEMQSAQNLGFSFDEIQQILDNGYESILNNAIEAEKFGNITDPTNIDWSNQEEVDYYMDNYFKDKGMPQDNTWLVMLLATKMPILGVINSIGNWYNKGKIPGPKGEEGWTWKKLLQDDWLKKQIDDNIKIWNPFRWMYTWAADKGGLLSGPTPAVREFVRRLGPIGAELLNKITDFGFEKHIKPEIEGYSSEELDEKIIEAMDENPDEAFEVYETILEKNSDYVALKDIQNKQTEIFKKYPDAQSSYDVYKAFEEAAIPYYGVNYETDDGSEWVNTNYNKGYSDSMLGKVDALQKEVDGYTTSYGEYARWAKQQDVNKPGKPINDPDFKEVSVDDHYRKTGSGLTTDLTKSPYLQAEIQWLADNTPGFEYETYAKLNKEMVDMRPYNVEKVNFDLEGLDFFKQMTDPKNPGKFEELYKEVKEKRSRIDDKFVTSDRERYEKAVEAQNTYDESVSRLIKYFEKIMDQESQAGDKMRDYVKKARDARKTEKEKMQKNADAELDKAKAFYDKNVKPIWDDYSSLFDSDKELDELYGKIDFDALYDNASREYLLQTEKERIKNNWSNEDEEENIDLSIEPVSPDSFVNELKAGLDAKEEDPRSAFAGTGDDAATFSFDGTQIAGYPNASEQQILRNQLNSILKSGGSAAAKREQERLLRMYGIYFPLASEGGGDVQLAHYKPKGKTLFERVSKLRKPNEFFNPDDIKPEFPENPPPKLDPKTGKHPEYGKKASRYKKLDPISANSMPPTGDPEIDAVVNKQKTINKIKKMARNK